MQFVYGSQRCAAIEFSSWRTAWNQVSSPFLVNSLGVALGLNEYTLSTEFDFLRFGAANNLVLGAITRSRREIVGAYSKSSEQVERLRRLLDMAPVSPSRAKTRAQRQTQRRLSADELERFKES